MRIPIWRCGGCDAVVPSKFLFVVLKDKNSESYHQLGSPLAAGENAGSSYNRHIEKYGVVLDGHINRRFLATDRGLERQRRRSGTARLATYSKMEPQRLKCSEQNVLLNNASGNMLALLTTSLWEAARCAAVCSQ